MFSRQFHIVCGCLTLAMCADSVYAQEYSAPSLDPGQVVDAQVEHDIEETEPNHITPPILTP